MQSGHSIEVIGSALIVRPVEMYRATIQISVRTRKAATGLKLVLELREQVVAALVAAGIVESLIQDGGCSVGHSTWSSKKQLKQLLCIQSKQVETIAKAMAGVENVFRAARTGYFSGIENDFSFVEDDPLYARTEEANELALREAVRNAFAKATALAEQSRLTLGTVTSIAEIPRPLRQSSEYRTNFEDPLDFDSHLIGRGYDTQLVDPTFTPVAPRQTTGMVQVRVRFDATPA